MTKHQAIKTIKTPGMTHRDWHIAVTGKGEYLVVPQGSPMVRQCQRKPGYVGKFRADEAINELEQRV